MNAEETYLELYKDAMLLLEQIKAIIHDMPAPESGITWEDVGDIGRIVVSLESVVFQQEETA